MEVQLAIIEKEHKERYTCIPWGNEQERANKILAAQNFDSAIHQYAFVASKLGIKRFGRPTKYREEFCALAYYMLADSRMICTVRFVASTLGVSHVTLYNWARLYPDFLYALTQGKAVQESWLATCLMHGWGNQQGIMAILRNLHGWRVNGRRSDEVSDLRQALEAQATGARRVQWDRITEEPHLSKTSMPVSNSLHSKQ